MAFKRQMCTPRIINNGLKFYFSTFVLLSDLLHFHLKWAQSHLGWLAKQLPESARRQNIFLLSRSLSTQTNNLKLSLFQLNSTNFIKLLTWCSVQLFQIYIRNVHWIESLTSSWMNQVCREENMSRAASQVNTSVDRWQSDFLLIEMTTICFGVKLKEKGKPKKWFICSTFLLKYT